MSSHHDRCKFTRTGMHEAQTVGTTDSGSTLVQWCRRCGAIGECESNAPPRLVYCAKPLITGVAQELAFYCECGVLRRTEGDCPHCGLKESAR